MDSRVYHHWIASAAVAPGKVLGMLLLLLLALVSCPAMSTADMTPPLVLTSSQQEWIRTHPRLVLGWVDSGWPPRQAGADPQAPPDAGYDLLKAIAARLGVTLEPRKFEDWSALMQAACANEIDVVSGVTLTADRTLCLVFAAEYAEIPFALVGRQHDARILADTHLRGLRVVTVEGEVGAGLVATRYPEALHRSVRDPLEALRLVDGMQADVYLADAYRASFLIAEKQHVNLALFRPGTLGTIGLHLATPNSRHELAGILDAALQSMSAAQRAALMAGRFKPIEWNDASHLTLSHAERTALERPVRMGYPADWAPLAYAQGGQMSGLAGDYLRRLRLAGANVQEEPMGWSQLEHAIQSGHVDAVIGVPEELEGLDDQWVKTEPFISISNVIVTHGGARAILSLSDLGGRTVATMDGRGLGPYLSAAAPAAKVVAVESPRAGLDMVVRGQVDAYIGNLAVVDVLMRDEYAGVLHVAALAGIEDRLVLAVRKPHQALASVFNRMLLTMLPREHEAIRNDWLSTPRATGVSLMRIARWGVPALLALLALLLVHGYGYLRLRREVAERRQVELRLAEVTDNLPAVVYQVHRSTNGELSFPFIAGDINSLFGVTRDEVLRSEKHLFEQIHPDDRPVVKDAIDDAALHLKFIDFEFRVASVDGWRWVRSRGQPILETDGSLKWSGYWIDVTQTREQAIALAMAREAAEEAASAKATFLATMSHEIRTPMSGILGMLEILEHTRLDEEQENVLAIINDAAQMLRQILDDILDFSKIEAGALSLELTPVSLRSIIDNVQRMLLPLATEKGLTLDMDVDVLVAAAHRADGVRLRQVLFNLLSNALKFTEHGRVRLELVRVEDSPASQRLKFSVVDTGIGISAEQTALLFRPFSQAEASTTRRYGGTGLGLSICMRLAELMGGHLALHSVPGCGTRVEFEVTLAKEDPALLALKASTPMDPDNEITVALRTHRVLVVEDHPTNQALMVWRMQQLGMDYVVASDGRQALEYLAEGGFDVVITDCQMPQMDGYALTREIRRREALLDQPHLPVIALTANVLEEERQRCRQAGMDTFLTKPVSLARLRECLIELLVPEELVAAMDDPHAASPGADPTPDHASLMAMFGSKLVVTQIISSLVNACDEDLAAVQAALGSEDRTAIQDRIHRIAGGIAVIGAEQLAQRARELILRLDDPEQAVPHADIQQFAGAVRSYLGRLQTS